MNKTRENYPSNIKERMALLVLREDTPVSELAVKYGIHTTVIHQSKKKALKSMETGFLGKAA